MVLLHKGIIILNSIGIWKDKCKKIFAEQGSPLPADHLKFLSRRTGSGMEWIRLHKIFELCIIYCIFEYEKTIRYWCLRYCVMEVFSEADKRPDNKPLEYRDTAGHLEFEIRLCKQQRVSE